MKLRNKEFDEIFEVITFGYVDSKTPNGNGDYPVEFISLEVMDEDGDNYEYRYRSLKDLNAVWEDYKQAEPLIKDEKIRKAVRAWAGANGYSLLRVGYHMLSDPNEGYVQIHFEDSKIIVEGNYGVHTIAELCGEEEE